MTLFPQTPHGSILILNRSFEPLAITFVFLVLTFKPLLSSAFFQFQNLSFKSSMSSLMITRSSAHSNSLTTPLLAFSVITFTTITNNSGDLTELHQSTAASTWWCGPRPRLGWVEMAVGLPEGPSYPGHSPFIFSLCCPLNDRRRAAHSIFKIGRLFSLFLLSCPTLALLRLLILLLLLMSGNVHPNSGPIFPCSVCAGTVTWRGKSGQCCACSKWVHLRCSQLSLSNFRALGAAPLP